MHYIYVITNLLNNKSYIGQTVNVKNRWKSHVWFSKNVNNHHTSAIANAIRKYGINNFQFQVIEEYGVLEAVNDAEEFYIRYFQTLCPNGYNQLSGGNNRKLSEKTKKLISEKLKIVGSFVGKRGKDHPNYGTKLSQDRKKNLSKKLSGDGGSNKKISSKIAREIYLVYLNDENISVTDLMKIYPLKRVALLNILNKKCWIDATLDLDDINIKKSL